MAVGDILRAGADIRDFEVQNSNPFLQAFSSAALPAILEGAKSSRQLRNAKDLAQFKSDLDLAEQKAKEQRIFDVQNRFDGNLNKILFGEELNPQPTLRPFQAPIDLVPQDINQMSTVQGSGPSTIDFIETQDPPSEPPRPPQPPVSTSEKREQFLKEVKTAKNRIREIQGATEQSERIQILTDAGAGFRKQKQAAMQLLKETPVLPATKGRIEVLKQFIKDKTNDINQARNSVERINAEQRQRNQKLNDQVIDFISKGAEFTEEELASKSPEELVKIGALRVSQASAKAEQEKAERKDPETKRQERAVKTIRGALPRLKKLLSEVPASDFPVVGAIREISSKFIKQNPKIRQYKIAVAMRAQQLSKAFEGRVTDQDFKRFLGFFATIRDSEQGRERVFRELEQWISDYEEQGFQSKEEDIKENGVVGRAQMKELIDREFGFDPGEFSLEVKRAAIQELRERGIRL